MQQISRPIIDKVQLTNTLWQLTIALEDKDTFALQVKPGQFFLLANTTPYLAYLRRPLFPADVVAPGNNEEKSGTPYLQFIMPISALIDPMLSWFVTRQIGERVDLLGPLGQGFTPQAYGNRLLLLASGPEISPLLFLLRLALQQNRDVVLGLETVRADELYPAHLIPPAAELHLVTQDGQFGQAPSILAQVAGLFHWAENLCVVGSRQFYQALKTELDPTRLEMVKHFANVLVNEPNLHVCGTGICTYCTISTKDGLRMVCQDGPVFDLAKLNLEDFS